MKKIITIILVGILAFSSVFAAGNQDKKAKNIEVSIGVVGSIYEDLWTPAQKALKAEGYEKAEEEYRDFLKFLRNSMIKDPSDMMALSFRVQCHVDLGEFEEAEKLCKLLSEDLANPLREQIEKARSGGEQ